MVGMNAYAATKAALEAHTLNLAAELTGVRVLEATLPRELVNLLSGPVRLLRLAVRYDPAEIEVRWQQRARGWLDRKAAQK